MSFFDLKVSPQGIKHSYNEQVEQYRGLCALLVFWPMDLQMISY